MINITPQLHILAKQLKSCSTDINIILQYYYYKYYIFKTDYLQSYVRINALIKKVQSLVQFRQGIARSRHNDEFNMDNFNEGSKDC